MGPYSQNDYTARLLSGSDEMTPEEKIVYNEDMASELGIFVIFLLLFFG